MLERDPDIEVVAHNPATDTGPIEIVPRAVQMVADPDGDGRSVDTGREAVGSVIFVEMDDGIKRYIVKDRLGNRAGIVKEYADHWRSDKWGSVEFIDLHEAVQHTLASVDETIRPTLTPTQHIIETMAHLILGQKYGNVESTAAMLEAMTLACDDVVCDTLDTDRMLLWKTLADTLWNAKVEFETTLLKPTSSLSTTTPPITSATPTGSEPASSDSG